MAKNKTRDDCKKHQGKRKLAEVRRHGDDAQPKR